MTNLARQARQRRCRCHRHPCRPVACPRHRCRSHSHPPHLDTSLDHIAPVAISLNALPDRRPVQVFPLCLPLIKLARLSPLSLRMCFPLIMSTRRSSVAVTTYVSFLLSSYVCCFLLIMLARPSSLSVLFLLVCPFSCCREYSGGCAAAECDHLFPWARRLSHDVV